MVFLAPHRTQAYSTRQTAKSLAVQPWWLRFQAWRQSMQTKRCSVMRRPPPRATALAPCADGADRGARALAPHARDDRAQRGLRTVPESRRVGVHRITASTGLRRGARAGVPPLGSRPSSACSRSRGAPSPQHATAQRWSIDAGRRVRGVERGEVHVDGHIVPRTRRQCGAPPAVPVRRPSGGHDWPLPVREVHDLGTPRSHQVRRGDEDLLAPAIRAHAQQHGSPRDGRPGPARERLHAGLPLPRADRRCACLARRGRGAYREPGKERA